MMKNKPENDVVMNAYAKAQRVKLQQSIEHVDRESMAFYTADIETQRLLRSLTFAERVVLHAHLRILSNATGAQTIKALIAGNDFDAFPNEFYGYTTFSLTQLANQMKRLSDKGIARARTVSHAAYGWPTYYGLAYTIDVNFLRKLKPTLSLINDDFID